MLFSDSLYKNSNNQYLEQFNKRMDMFGLDENEEERWKRRKIKNNNKKNKLFFFIY